MIEIYNQRVRGKRITIYNATKEQLRTMIRDRDYLIGELDEQLSEKQEVIDELLEILKNNT